MKKIIGWLLSWTLYYMGDAVSKVLNTNVVGNSERLASIVYPVYNWLMHRSDAIQNWGGAGPWENVE